MQRIYHDGDVTWFTEYDPLKKTLNLYGVKDMREHYAYTAFSRKDPANGFSQSREGAFGRKIAAVDVNDYRSWQREFERIGGKQQDRWVEDWQKFLKKKLAADPRNLTVDKLVNKSANDGHVVIR